MKPKSWLCFAAIQLIGIGLSLYSTQFQVGVGGIREYLWIPAALMLLPGILLGYGIGALNFLKNLGKWGGIPFFLSIIVINAVSWYAMKLALRARRRL